MPASVLLIEDNADTARLISGALRSAGESFEVATVFSARDGLQHLAANAVDCVLLDYRLPDADGLGCLREMRQAHPDVPVVVITGAGSEEVAVEAMKLGASDYLVKHGKYLVTVPLVVREALGRMGESSVFEEELATLRRENAELRAQLDAQRRR